MEKEIREAIINRMRAGTIRTAQITDACNPQLQKILSGSPNTAAGLTAFWHIVGKIVTPDTAFKCPSRQPLATWTLRANNANE